MIDFGKLFIEKAKIKHGGKYFYHHVDYINAHTKVRITCPIHGDFLQTPNAHQNGAGCPKCNGGVAMSTDEFIELSNKVHKGKYDYTKTDLNKRDENGRVIITCRIHGDFLQKPYYHLNGSGCQDCCSTKKYTTETYINACKEKFGENFIDYSLVNYINRDTDIVLKCKKCNKEFSINPHNHLKRGDGCPFCKISKLEKDVYNRLLKEEIKFEMHKRFDWMSSGKSHKSLDFYLPDYNIAIECQGMQHFNPIGFFGGEKAFEKQVKNDKLKYETCKDKGIDILYYSDVKEKNVYTNLDKLLKKVTSRNK